MARWCIRGPRATNWSMYGPTLFHASRISWTVTLGMPVRLLNEPMWLLSVPTMAVHSVASRAGKVAETWHFGGAKYGWSQRLVQGKRVLVYLTPQAGQLLVGVALGEKAIAVAEATGLASARTREIVAAAPRYAEGRGVRFAVATDDDLAVAKELARTRLGR